MRIFRPVSFFILIFLSLAQSASAAPPTGVGVIQLGESIQDIIANSQNKIHEERYAVDSSDFAATRCGIRIYHTEDRIYGKIMFKTYRDKVMYIVSEVPVPRADPSFLAHRFINKYGAPSRVRCKRGDYREGLDNCGKGADYINLDYNSLGDTDERPDVLAVHIEIQSNDPSPKYRISIARGLHHYYNLIRECQLTEWNSIRNDAAGRVAIPD